MVDRQNQRQPQIVSAPDRPTAPGVVHSIAGPWLNRIVGEANVPPGELIPNPANWRRHPKSQRAAIAAALGEVGWVQRVIRNRRSGHLLDGHVRVAEALARGEPTIPVLDVDLSEAEERFVLTTFDPLGAMAEADATKLEELLDQLTTSDEALLSMLAGLAEASGLRREGSTEPDAVLPVPAPADVYIRPGELWILGSHRLVCGDSTDAATVARLMAGKQAECCWTDPPFGVEYVGKTADKLTIENDDEAGSDRVISGAFRVAPLAPSAPFYIAAPSGPRSLAFRLALQAVGWRLHQELVWVKDAFTLGHSDYQIAHEAILYGYVPGPGRPGRGRHAGTKWHGDHAQSSVLTYPKPASNRDHPTQKPVGLIEQCLRNSSARGDLIFEPFAGSGSTIIAAEALGRRCFAIEIDPAYVQVAIERWRAYTGQEARRDD